MQRGFPCSDPYLAIQQFLFGLQGVFRFKDVFTGGFHVFIQHRRFRSQGYALAGTLEKDAVQFFFQHLNGMGDGGLCDVKRLGSLRKASEFGNVIEGFVRIKADAHGRFSFLFLSAADGYG